MQGPVKKLLAACAARLPPKPGAVEARLKRPPDPERWGICCSGGGVRSASYCLGALQVLREEKVLQRTSYVSAVSGGSYVASAIASAASRSNRADIPAFAPGSVEEEHLRNHSSYMAPDAAGKVQLAFRLTAGALFHIFLLALLAAAVAWPVSWIYGAVSDQLADGTGGYLLKDLGWLVLISALPAAVGAFCNLELWKTSDDYRAVIERLSIDLGAFSAFLFLVLVLVPQGVLAMRWLGDASGGLFGADGETGKAAELLAVAGGASGLTAGLGAVSTFVSRRRRILLRVAAYAAGPLVVLIPVLIAVNLGAALGYPGWPAALALVAAAVLVGFWRVTDLNQSSLHPFYRRRLSSAFYTRRQGTGAKRVAVAAPELSWKELGKRERAAEPIASHGRDSFPQLIVCAAANITEPGATPPGRAAMPFVFTSEEVGVPRHDVPLEVYDPHGSLTVGRSVAMSGAAVSPLMGKKTIRAVRFLMALMNVRLGVWLPNPRYTGKLPKFRLHFIVREMLGLAKLHDPYLYVTDGGHFDNLGLVELLRRGCGTVFCLDGGGDPPGSFRALGEAAALARSELQVDVDIDPLPITPDKDNDNLAVQPYAIGTLRFRSAPDGSEHDGDVMGQIIYCRCAITGNAPWDVRDFARRDKTFPFHSTMDQLFTDEKFESYRALGGHAAREAVDAWRRDALRSKITEVLQKRARRGVCIAYRELVEEVQGEMSEAELPTLRPLLDAINAEEEAAERPPLVLVVQNAPPPADLQSRLDEVYSYWSLDADPAELSTNN